MLDGNALDSIIYINNGQLEGPIPAINRKSDQDSALHFDGDNDIVFINDNAKLYMGCEFTISAWIYPESIKSQEIIRKGSQVNGKFKERYGLALSGKGDFVFSINTNNGFIQARKKDYTENTWYLVSGILKNETMYLYINGVLEDTVVARGNIINDPTLLIGSRLRLPSSTFHGTIDDVRIYDYALSEQDVIELYTQ